MSEKLLGRGETASATSSRAHQWAAAAARESALDMRPYTADALRRGPEEGGVIRIHVSLGRHLDQPVLLWTDHRVGSVVLGGAEALGLARWILEAFEDPAP
jgi:hypothetical protein